MVDYLAGQGYCPAFIGSDHYWYLSPLRQEKKASFKVKRSKNIWIDFGTGKGGKLVDFCLLFHHCTVKELLQKFTRPAHIQEQDYFFSHQQRNVPDFDSEKIVQQSAPENAIKIISTGPVSIVDLLHYFHQRTINFEIAKQHLCEVSFELAVNGKLFYALGFKNNAGGYELRNAFFKASSSPKYISYFDNNSNQIAVFEGAFDFLSYLSITKNNCCSLTNFLVLNSLSFFERSLLLMEKHEHVFLYLDHDPSAKKCVDVAKSRSQKYVDQSSLYKGFKDLNEWHTSLDSSFSFEQQCQQLRNEKLPESPA